MKVLIIGGNRFVGLRLSLILDRKAGVDLTILNRTGQAAHTKNATLYKADRNYLTSSYVDKDWDIIIDFACYELKHARASLEYFGKVGKYIFISTASVYEYGKNIPESAFNPSLVKLNDLKDNDNSYQFGKRQAEIAFTQESKFKTSLIRFPFILGPDDYTQRLEFHISKIENGEPFYVPNLDAETSFIHSEDAANFLHWYIEQDFSGPLNVANLNPINLKSFIALVEKRTGKIANLMSTSPKDESLCSPYGIEQDSSLDLSRLKQLGYKIRSLDTWLPNLISSFATTGKPELH